MISIFKTNISTREESDKIISGLIDQFAVQSTVDVEDCDKVLRVVGEVDPAAIENYVKEQGFLCADLE
jgi:hypothetical protein